MPHTLRKVSCWPAKEASGRSSAVADERTANDVEAAWIDGCSVWGAFLRITLPLTAPGLAATAVLCFIFSWNDFFYALILTRTNAQTAPVAIVNFIQYEGYEWGKIAAGGTLVMMPVVVFTMLVRTYLVRGLTAGGIKD